MDQNNIRLATEKDCKAIENIARDAYAMYVPRMDRQPFPMLDDYSSHITAGHAFVLEQNGEIAGYVILIPQKEGELLLDNIAIHPHWQNHGLGADLLLFAETHARDEGFSRITLYTNEAMKENLSLYPHFGYRETGRAIQNGYKRVFFEKSL